MHNRDADRLIDILIGEAVLSLLKARGSLTTQRLIQRLREMKAHEPDPRRREALTVAIAETGKISHAFKRRRTAQVSTEREGSLRDNSHNVVPLFGKGKPTDSKKIH